MAHPYRFVVINKRKDVAYVCRAPHDPNGPGVSDIRFDPAHSEGIEHHSPAGITRTMVPIPDRVMVGGWKMPLLHHGHVGAGAQGHRIVQIGLVEANRLAEMLEDIAEAERQIRLRRDEFNKLIRTAAFSAPAAHRKDILP